jgi:hypothetical protein
VFTLLISSLTVLFKIGTVIYFAVATQTHLGECYIEQTLVDLVYSSMSIEAGALAVLMFCVDHVRARTEQVILMNQTLERQVLQTS